MGKKLLKWLSSLRLAVLVIVALSILIAVGTFVESRWDAQAAQKLVYKTPWMFLIMGMLATNLIAVMVDRWPWKWRHAPFLCAHVGILILLAGSLVTMFYGVDGNLRVGIGESSQFVAVPETDLSIWSSFDGDRYSKVFQQEVDFFLQPPQKNPIRVQLMDDQEFRVLRFEPYALPSRRVISSNNERLGAGLRFVLQNSRVNVTEWLLEKRPGELATHELGPAKVHLGAAPKTGRGFNEIFIVPEGSKKQQVFNVTVFVKDQAAPVVRSYPLSLGQSYVTPWMGLELKILFYHPHAEETWDYKFISKPTPLSTAVVEVEFMGKRHWVQVNDVVKFYSDRAVYIVSYAMRRLDLGFPVHLKDFKVARYSGIMKAANYESHVEVPGLPGGGSAVISMNEPLKFQGFTLYQASFQEGPDGSPIASILSVNKDPGRFWKYLGCAILSIGVVWLFVNRRRSTRAQAPGRGEISEV